MLTTAIILDGDGDGDIIDPDDDLAIDDIINSFGGSCLTRGR